MVQANRIAAFVQPATKFMIELDVFVMWQDPIRFNMTAIHKYYEEQTAKTGQKQKMDLRTDTTIVFDTFKPRNVWYPAIFCPRMRKMETPDEAGVLLSESLTILFELGMSTKTPTFILYRRIMGDVSCAMDFKAYPFDKHECQIPLEFRDFEKLEIVGSFVGPKNDVIANTIMALFSFKSNYTTKAPSYSHGKLVQANVPAVSVQVTLTRKRGIVLIIALHCVQ